MSEHRVAHFVHIISSNIEMVNIAHKGRGLEEAKNSMANLEKDSSE